MTRRKLRALERRIESTRIEHGIALSQIQLLHELLQESKQQNLVLAADKIELTRKLDELSSSRSGGCDGLSDGERELLAANEYHQIRIRALEEFIQRPQDFPC